MVDITGKIKDDRLIKNYAHYQGYKWACIFIVICIPMTPFFGRNGDTPSIEEGFAVLL